MKTVAWLCAVGVFVALAVGVAHRRSHGEPVTRPSPSVGSAAVVLAGAEAQTVGRRMQVDGDVADDVIFLIVAALQARCASSQAHDLPRMAVVAGLPVLKAIADTTRKATADLVREAVRNAPCGAPFALHVGPYVRELDPARYMAAFPDSYFDPDMDVVPDELAKASLHARAVDECSRVAYATLPLDALREWQCSGVRADARSRIRALCNTEGVEAAHAAVAIRSMVDGLPPTCR
ncbi:hypothetical protein L2Y94_14285 [Luteibacter aegosomatis]|uniref:hypothetical protein n=1 Tax=Luteibacter aegosomatis TaxID=2911537 RepID=UPI001FF91A19|nr:hypothetical protein [Luteibacter aegosomatis]UPG84502.1 hypothetical protein L2Y94_14285 [Luteibacter aegosomatis]